MPERKQPQSNSLKNNEGLVIFLLMLLTTNMQSYSGIRSLPSTLICLPSSVLIDVTSLWVYQ